MWSTVTLSQYNQLALIERSEDGVFEKAYNRLKVLGIKPASTLEAMIAQIPDWVEHMPSSEIQKEYIIDGVTYVPHVNFMHMAPERFLDFINTVKERDQNDPEGWAYLCSIILSQPGEPYDYETHIERAKHFWDKMTVDQIYPLAVFFSLVLRNLQTIIADSSLERLRTQLADIVQTFNESTGSSLNTGDGSPTYLKSLK